MKQRTQSSTLRELASFSSTIAVALFVMTFLFQNFMIPSSSMASTLLVGDHVLVERVTLAPSSKAPLTYAPLKHDEPVVFYRPAPNAQGEHDILVKRVIGLPGDRIHLQHGVVYRNGQRLIEPYAALPDASNYRPYNDDFPAMAPTPDTGALASWALEMPSHLQGGDLVVPQGSYFMMGDNRPNSLDSRYWGLVPHENLIGRPLFIYWSFKTSEDQQYQTSLSERSQFTAHQLLHFFDQTRWDRTFRRVQ